jgi:hypothetical protein
MKPDANRRETDRLLETNLRLCSEAFFRARQGAGHPSRAPIFVIGMPRSGSTLIEQILIAHPDVEGMGECNAMAEVIARYPPFVPQGPDHYRRIGAAYLEALRRRGWTGSPRVVDKSLGNFIAAPLLRLAFPRCRIVHPVRHPLDVCLSSFRRNFGEMNDWAFDLLDIAGEYRCYRRAMDAWRALMPGAIIDVEHEALVADPENQIHRLLAALDLRWDPACLAPHAAARHAQGGAADQVRRPINPEGVARWRHYERQLAPIAGLIGDLRDTPRLARSC